MYQATYYIWTDLKLTYGSITFTSEALVEVEVDVDRMGDVASWTVTRIGTEDERKRFVVMPDPTGTLSSLIADLQHDADGSFDRLVEREVTDDEHAPRGPTLSQQHSTINRWGAL